jgi:ABC-type transport system involved in multi-copper enzyme maturation permease subunit
MNPVILLARKEAGELVLSPRGIGWLLALAAALSGFGLLLVSNTELSLLDNAQVVYDMAGIVTVLGALLAIVVGTDAIAGERERGSLMPLLLTPVSRLAILTGKLGGQLIAWAVMSVVAVPYLWAVGSTGQNLANGVVLLALLGTPVVLAFGFLSMGLAARLGSSRGSLLVALIGLMLAASPLVLGPGLRQSAIGRAFDAVNPVSGALNAYDAVIIDSQSIASQWEPLALVLASGVLALWFAAASFRKIAI